jgi:hypothetical protein
MIKVIASTAYFTLFAAIIGIFSSKPAYQHLREDQALIRLSISHAGQLIGACHKRSEAELQKLSRNMRALQDCPRARSPVMIEVELDGKVLYHDVIKPTGLAHDGASTVYRRFALAAGEHRLAVRLNDTGRASGFDYERSELVRLQPAQVLVIDFDRQKGGVLIK